MPRILRLVSPLIVVLPLAVVATPPAAADPVPSIAEYWPRCGAGSDDDNRYCIASVTKNGTAVPEPDWGTDGVYDEPYVDLIGAGDVRFGLYTTTVGPGGSDAQGEVAPDDVWSYTVNTGSIRPREVYGHVRNTTFSTGGNATDGYTFTLTFQPVRAEWYGYAPGHDFCVVGDCGDETTVADLEYAGFVTGYVTDLESSGLGAAEIAARDGMVRTYNAQDAYEYYDVDTNSIVVRLANPHFEMDGTTVAQGTYDTFLPDAYLTSILEIPDPSSLTGGSFVVQRSAGGATTSVPVTLTHEPGGIRIRITGITFSSPTYRIRPKASTPGRPRWGSVTHVAAHRVRVRFRPPVADGGAAVTAYRARCRRGSGDWHKASGPGSPLFLSGMPRQAVSCQVRAVNRVGAGDWSGTRAG